MALETELKYFEANREDLLKKHKGKFALIIGKDLLGTYDDPAKAYEAGIRDRGNVPMLVKLITESDEPEKIPAMTLGLTSARP
jgi:hypothetical protein